jgi:endonuclease/exonuclease/phosphatase family metal-dependent hydrolase
MAGAVKELDADIVCLQEAFAAPDRGYDTAVYIAERAGYRVARAPGRKKFRLCGGHSVESYSNLAVLTRNTVKAARTVELSNDPADGDRKALMVEVASPFGPLTIMTLHLTHLDGRDDLRRQQFAEALAALPEDTRAVVAGDLNCPAAVLAEPGTLVAAHRIDDATNQRRLATSTLNPVNKTAATRNGNAIDHIFVASPHVMNPGPMLGETNVVMNLPDPKTGLYPSDHAGVFAHLTE